MDNLKSKMLNDAFKDCEKLFEKYLKGIVLVARNHDLDSVSLIYAAMITSTLAVRDTLSAMGLNFPDGSSKK